MAASVKPEGAPESHKTRAKSLDATKTLPSSRPNLSHRNSSDNLQLALSGISLIYSNLLVTHSLSTPPITSIGSSGSQSTILSSGFLIHSRENSKLGFWVTERIVVLG
ncbi:hypothetical protein L2E82_46141 [Cichorium intybus]|uniref:Uncharacterized protein n=1 Tax=Cichorium intybus TaxID=13427 RepID=A0ACB8YSL7_CICIN|nr:hypothetical protein L2E82_46141 [Cichorium intybus]